MERATEVVLATTNSICESVRLLFEGDERYFNAAANQKLRAARAEASASAEKAAEIRQAVEVHESAERELLPQLAEARAALQAQRRKVEQLSMRNAELAERLAKSRGELAAARAAASQAEQSVREQRYALRRLLGLVMGVDGGNPTVSHFEFSLFDEKRPEREACVRVRQTHSKTQIFGADGSECVSADFFAELNRRLEAKELDLNDALVEVRKALRAAATAPPAPAAAAAAAPAAAAAAAPAAAAGA